MTDKKIGPGEALLIVIDHLRRRSVQLHFVAYFLDERFFLFQFRLSASFNDLRDMSMSCGQTFLRFWQWGRGMD